MSGIAAWARELAELYVPSRRPPAAHPPATLPARPAAETLTATVAQIAADPAFVDRLAEAVTARRATATPPPAGQPVPAGKPAVPPAPTTTRAAPATAGPRTAPAPPPVWPAGGLDLSAARAARADEQLPEQPVTAACFVAGGVWRWVDIGSTLPGAHQWGRLARGLVAAGPWRALRVRAGHLTAAFGECRFHRADEGAAWVDIVIDDRLDHGEATRTLRHEFAHLGDETAARTAARTAAVWHGGFAAGHRVRAAEEFAVAAEDWLSPTTPAAELLAAARRHQRERGRRA